MTCLLLLLQQLMRLALVDVLLILAPLGLAAWILPQTQARARLWSSVFLATVFTQFVQVITLKLGATGIDQPALRQVPGGGDDRGGQVPQDLRDRRTGPAVPARGLQGPADGVTLDKASLTVRELTELFYRMKENAGRRNSTLGNYATAIDHVNRLLGDTPAQQLRAEHVDRLLRHLRREKGFGAKYTGDILALLTAVLEFGVKRQILTHNVGRQVERPRPSRPKIKTMAQTDLERFLAVVTDPRDRAIFYLFLTTGMRRGELVGLRWEDFEPETGKLVIKRRIVRARTRKGMDVDEPKTPHSYRVNKLPLPVMEVVLQWRERQEVERTFYRSWTEGGWLFTSRHQHQAGKHLDPSSINWLLDHYLKLSGVPHVTVHSLRHSFCTWLLQSGVSARDVQVAVGHSRVSITLDMYWEATSGADDRVADAASGIVFPEIPPKAAPRRGNLRLVGG